MFCTNCGQENRDDARFCVKCGQPLNEPDQSDASGGAYGWQNDQAQFNGQNQYNDQGQFNGQNQYNDQSQFNGQNQYNNQGQFNGQGQYNGSGMAPGNGINVNMLQIFSVIMSVVCAWYFIKYAFPAIGHILSAVFGLIGDLDSISYLPGTIGMNGLSLLQAASFALMAAIFFVIFRRWKPERTPEYSLTVLTAGIIVFLVALIHFLINFRIYIWDMSEAAWFFWILAIDAVCVVGFFVFTILIGVPVALVRQGDSFGNAEKSSFKYVEGEFTDELKTFQDAQAAKREAADARQPYGNQGQQNIRRVKSHYSFAAFFFLGFLTCGIYQLYIIHCISRDINITGAGDGKNTHGLLVLILLSMITCGIYPYIYWFKLGNRLQSTGNRYGVYIQENGTTYLLWILFGVLLCGLGPYIGFYQILKNMNIVNHAYMNACMRP
ncbi:MAG: DUF4234 domain-containing protein [Lachnospiraceae bacterium]|nr:DUF4234 domain-containing protein [Lachnospiraceae bacterium]